MSLTVNQIESKLKEQFPDAKIQLKDLTGGGDHWQLVIESKAFRDKTLIEQHQLVYGAVKEWMHREIHALSMTTIEV